MSGNVSDWFQGPSNLSGNTRKTYYYSESSGQTCTENNQCASGYTCVNGTCTATDRETSSIQQSNYNTECGTGNTETPSRGPSLRSSGGSSCGGSVSTARGCTQARAGICDITDRTTGSGRKRGKSQGGSGGSGGCGRPEPCGGPGGLSGGCGSPTMTIQPPEDECDSFCDSWEQSFGDRAPDCPPGCGECEECSIFGTCESVSHCACAGDCMPCYEVCDADGGCRESLEATCNPPPPPAPKRDCAASPGGCGGVASAGGQPCCVDHWNRHGCLAGVGTCCGSSMPSCFGKWQNGTCASGHTVQFVRCHECFCNETWRWMCANQSKYC